MQDDGSGDSEAVAAAMHAAASRPAAPAREPLGEEEGEEEEYLWLNGGVAWATEACCSVLYRATMALERGD